tara:strand:- start:175 stop:402 length:228 start_codon:yes stop_codon:yes gene_type:complete
MDSEDKFLFGESSEEAGAAPSCCEDRDAISDFLSIGDRDGLDGPGVYTDCDEALLSGRVYGAVEKEGRKGDRVEK